MAVGGVTGARRKEDFRGWLLILERDFQYGVNLE